MIFRVFVKRTCPFSGIKSTPTSSFASRIAPNKLSSPFTTEPPTHYHIKGYVGLFAERCEIRYSPLELRIQTCTTRWYPSIGKVVNKIVDVWLFEYDGEVDLSNATTDEAAQVAWMNRSQIKELFDANMFVDTLEYFFMEVDK